MPIMSWCRIHPAIGGAVEGPEFVRFLVDGVVRVEVPWKDKGKQQCLELTKGIASTHPVLCAERSAQEEAVQPEKDMTDWNTEQVIFGFHCRDTKWRI